MSRTMLSPPAFATEEDWSGLLMPLLTALHWKGTESNIRAAMPPSAKTLTLHQLRDVVAYLGFTSIEKLDYPLQLREEMLPVIHLQGDADGRLLLTPAEVAALPSVPARFLIFTPIEPSPPPDATYAGLRMQFARFRPPLALALVISFFIGVLAVAPSFFTMAIYDHIIATGSARGLFMMSAGVLAALAAEIFLRHQRNRYLAWFGARIDHFVSCSVFERLLYFPPAHTERASISLQLARLRDFDSIREFFTGPLAPMMFELPLISIYLIAIVIISGGLVTLPLLLILCYSILFYFMNGVIKERNRTSAQLVTKRQDFLLETVTHLRALRLAGMEEVWQQRCRQLSAQAALASFRAGFMAQLLENISSLLMTACGVGTLIWGVNAVIANTMSPGALIAAMMLIWRIISPLQVCCSSLSRMHQLAASTRQIQHLLSVPSEQSSCRPPSALPEMSMHITYHRVSLRYLPDADPALLGVSVDIKPGQIAAICGNNGSGKSSLLRVLMGMYPPQSGSVRIDGIDIRQMNPLSLRQAIAYVPQTADFLPGSIRDNLLYSCPTASETMCLRALEDSVALGEVLQLPKGLDTIIAGEGAEPISFLLRQRLNLARAYVRPARLYAFDESSHSLGKENDYAFTRKIASLRGQATVLMVTHREDHMRLADILLVLEKGELTHLGAPTQVLHALRSKK